MPCPGRKFPSFYGFNLMCYLSKLRGLFVCRVRPLQSSEREKAQETQDHRHYDERRGNDGAWVSGKRELANHTLCEIVGRLGNGGRGRVPTGLVERRIECEHGVVRDGLVEHSSILQRTDGAGLEERGAVGAIGANDREVGNDAVLRACLRLIEWCAGRLSDGNVPGAFVARCCGRGQDKCRKGEQQYYSKREEDGYMVMHIVFGLLFYFSFLS